MITPLATPRLRPSLGKNSSNSGGHGGTGGGGGKGSVVRFRDDQRSPSASAGRNSGALGSTASKAAVGGSGGGRKSARDGGGDIEVGGTPHEDAENVSGNEAPRGGFRGSSYLRMVR